MRGVFLIVALVIISCSNDNDISTEPEKEAHVLGSWQLIEQMEDPGDGSGVFKPIQSNKVLTFKSNGLIEAQNTSLCAPYSQEKRMQGTFSSDDSIIYTTCENPNINKIFFEIDASFLQLDYVSNEGFSQRYKRID